MPRIFSSVEPTPAERAARLPGDDLVPNADVVMDRAFTVDAALERVWPWVLQLGKRRAGWYLPRWCEQLLPRRRRASRVVKTRWQRLAVGDVIPDYGGRDAAFTVARIDPPYTLVYRSRRGATEMSWAILLSAQGVSGTRVQLRLRMAPVRHRRLARNLGGFFDAATIAGMAAGLRERVGRR